jgi:tetratricopeptide (TPR) repeat protein
MRESACIICLESEPPPIQSGCACRSDAGLAHVRCRVQVAASKRDIVNKDWGYCSTCTQAFTGEMKRKLSSALSARVREFHADDDLARELAEQLELNVQMAEGQYAAAERAARDMHDARRKSLGDEDKSTLAAAGSVAMALSKQGKHAASARIQREVLSATKRGDDDTRAVVEAMGGLANALSEQGKHADAERLNGEALEISTRVLGAEHLDTLALKSISAWNLALKGDFAEAADATRAVLDVHTRVMGAQHPLTMHTKSMLASSLSGLGKCDEAVALGREVLAAHRSQFGDEGPATLVSVENLANMLDRQGAYAEAGRLWSGLHAHRKIALGEEHPGTLDALSGVVFTTWRQGRREEAAATQRLLVAAARRTGHPATRQMEVDLMSMAPASLIVGARVVLRGLVAKKMHNGSAGTVLSVEGKIYTVKLDAGTSMKLRRQSICVLCTGCARERDAARACGKCMSAWYCSVECQRAHWRTHKPACASV